MKIKVAYILSNINKALAFEWIAEEINAEKFDIFFILLNPGGAILGQHLQTLSIPVYSIRYTGKKDLIKAFVNIYRILKKEKTHIVHCHLFDACITGLVAAKFAGIKKRVYTRHHATFHQVYFPRAVWYDKFISSMATDIVAISHNVKQTLISEGVWEEKIHLIHHGFKLECFKKKQPKKEEHMRKKYLIKDKYPVIGVISRYFELKGIQYIIPAFSKLLHAYPGALLLLANTTGNYSAEIKKQLYQLPECSYKEISFEPDIFSLYHIFDIFIHVPIDPSIEAFGQTYVEALAAGIPSIFTLSGVAKEFIENKKNALVVPFKDSESIYEAFMDILNDSQLAEQINCQGRVDIEKMFSLNKMMHSLEELYES